MKIFISYSTDDLSLVHRIAEYLRPHVEVLFWDKSKVPGQEAWPTIFNWIDQSDLVLAVISDKTVSRAMSVGQEIGRAKAKTKTIIPLVAPGVSSSDLGCLNGITYQKIDPNNPGPALKNIEKGLLERKLQFENTQTLLLLGGILALLWLVSKK
ncbi:MAG: toll/interleukin-1 receptor domain-containing protein [Nitrospirae bacterium]|nr:toll/interleukin-1 receptor domain-containing protein [Nitrospirota bacterium]MBI3351505.1 toll/interleukin-1 receptor domain-containing protein [Nitrospirota bacterium]